jgi:hypothetical protein
VWTSRSRIRALTKHLRQANNSTVSLSGDMTPHLFEAFGSAVQHQDEVSAAVYRNIEADAFAFFFFFILTPAGNHGGPEPCW